MSSELVQSVDELKHSVHGLIRLYQECKQSKTHSVRVTKNGYYFVKNNELCALTSEQNDVAKKLEDKRFNDTGNFTEKVGDVTLSLLYIVDRAPGYQGQGFMRPKELFIQLRDGEQFYVLFTLNNFFDVEVDKSSLGP